MAICASLGEVLRMKKQVLKRIDEITTEFDLHALQPKTEADIELVTDEQAHKACQEFGEVDCDPVSADNSYATGDSTKFTMQDMRSTVEVCPMTKKKEKSGQIFHLKAELIHLKSGASMKCEVKQENGRHTIICQPVNRGRHSLHIRVNGRHIQGSPYPIAVAPSPDILFPFQRPSRVVHFIN